MPQLQERPELRTEGGQGPNLHGTPRASRHPSRDERPRCLQLWPAVNEGSMIISAQRYKGAPCEHGVGLGAKKF